MEWYLGVWNKYADFSGRARRTEYWSWTLINYVVIFLIVIFEGLIGTEGILVSLYALAFILPNWAVSVRRLHDVGYSGWMLLVSIIPLIGPLFLFILTVTDSESGTNQYGPNPKELVDQPSHGRGDSIPDAFTGKANITGNLERLASLHRNGQLSDSEYQEAKNRLFG